MTNYSKPDQAPFAGNLADGEFVVQLDTGDLVAVKAMGFVEPNTGNTVIHAEARAANADGSVKCDANNQIIASGYTFSADAATVAALGGMESFRRKMLYTVLGEDAQWPNPPTQDVLDHASIRTNLAAASHSGPAADINTLL